VLVAACAGVPAAMACERPAKSARGLGCGMI
jgi:hypothetical protein